MKEHLNWIYVEELRRMRVCNRGRRALPATKQGTDCMRTPPPAPALDSPRGCADFLSRTLDSPPGRAISGAGVRSLPAEERRRVTTRVCEERKGAEYLITHLPALFSRAIRPQSTLFSHASARHPPVARAFLPLALSPRAWPPPAAQRRLAPFFSRVCAAYTPPSA